MSIEIGLLFGAVTLIMGIATYFAGRHGSAKKEGSEWGELKSDIKHIKKNIDEMKQSHSANASDLKGSISRVYDRMDERFREHLQQYHKIGGHTHGETAKH